MINSQGHLPLHPMATLACIHKVNTAEQDRTDALNQEGHPLPLQNQNMLLRPALKSSTKAIQR